MGIQAEVYQVREHVNFQQVPELNSSPDMDFSGHQFWQKILRQVSFYPYPTQGLKMETALVPSRMGDTGI